MKGTKHTTDFLAKNTYDQANYHKDRYSQLMQNQVTRRQRLQSAQKRKETLSFENYKKKYFLIHKWDIVRARREEMYEFMDKLRTEKHFKEQWMLLRLTHEFAKRIYA